MAIGMRMRPLAIENRPEGYTKCDYLESTGTQYVDTGFQSNASTRIELDMQQVRWGTSVGPMMWAVGTAYCPYPFIFGFAEKRSSNMQGYYLLGNDNLGGYISNNATSGIPDAKKVERGLLSNNSKTFIWDGVILTISSTAGNSSVASDNNMLLFGGHNSKNAIVINKGMRVWSYKHLHEDKLKQHLIPVLDPSRRPCMFDLITQTPFYNENTSGSDFLYKAYSYPFNPSDNWHTVNKKIKEIIGLTKYTLELVEDGN